MTVVLGFSGKKQSGKDTLLTGLSPYLSGTVKKYSFADGLKTFLVDVMGLRPDQVWGTDEQKNSKTTYLWEHLPEFMRWENGGRWVDFGGPELQVQLPLFENSIGINEFSPERLYWSLRAGSNSQQPGFVPFNLKNGAMSARELMQVMGTDICRRMFSQHIWVHATFRTIAKDGVDFAIIPDLRFQSEIQGVMSRGGLIVRLMRDVSQGDEHPSETALDGYDWSSLGERVLVVPPELGIDDTKEMVWNWLSTKLETK
jgi:hypothetical protein